MRKISIFFLFFLVQLSLLQAAIFETAHFKEIENYLNPETLVLLDIDDTLLIPSQTLGSDVWFLYQVEQHKANGLNRTDAVEKALAEWEALRHLTKVKIVEEGTQAIINQMQQSKCVVMGLTTQGLALANRTKMQLKDLGIDLAKTCPSHDSFYFGNGSPGHTCLQAGVLYREGILFTSGTKKGTALLKLLDCIHYRPKHILFINDKLTHLKDVETSVEEAGIEFTGLRYSYSDERVNSFNKEIAEIQWKHSRFDRILSDQEAQELLELTARP